MMTPTLQQFGIDKLSVDDRVLLAHAILQSIDTETRAASLTPEQEAELERRLADSIARPGEGTPWEEVYASLLSRARP